MATPEGEGLWVGVVLRLTLPVGVALALSVLVGVALGDGVWPAFCMAHGRGTRVHTA